MYLCVYVFVFVCILCLSKINTAYKTCAIRESLSEEKKDADRLVDSQENERTEKERRRRNEVSFDTLCAIMERELPTVAEKRRQQKRVPWK